MVKTIKKLALTDLTVKNYNGLTRLERLAFIHTTFPGLKTLQTASIVDRLDSLKTTDPERYNLVLTAYLDWATAE